MEQRTLEGQVAIVTGASRGIGRSIALALARNGARVSLAARGKADLQTIRSEIESFGGQAATFPTDVSREADVGGLGEYTHLLSHAEE